MINGPVVKIPAFFVTRAGRLGVNFLPGRDLVSAIQSHRVRGFLGTMFVLGASVLGTPLSVRASDPPHPTNACNSCHVPHNALGDVLLSVAGNANSCVSCHQSGGSASILPFSTGMEAVPWSGLATGVAAGGSSHRWDSSPGGRIVFLGGSATPSTGVLLPLGTCTGAYPKTFTITMVSNGAPGTARFNWICTPPVIAGTNLATGPRVALSDGIVVAFTDGGTGGTFRVGDRWNLYVRPRIRQPAVSPLGAHLMIYTNADTSPAVLTNGMAVCSTCHDQHKQKFPPFDASAPAYGGSGTGDGRHFMRMSNNVNQMCFECHSALRATNALAGTHPTGLRPRTNGFYKVPGAALPLETGTTNMGCLTCHTVHYSPSYDGSLLRKTNAVDVCIACHTLANTLTPGTHMNPTNTRVLWPGGQYGSLMPARTNAAQRGGCLNCHATHGWPDASNPGTNYPVLLADREENLCFTCHDGSPSAKNIRSYYTNVFTHPTMLYTNRHSSAEDEGSGSVGAFGTTNRHAECTDCHNPHQTYGTVLATNAPFAASRLWGTARVAVTNTGTGSNIVYTFRNQSDTNAVREYEICFKCHSGWSTRPANQLDIAARVNTRNPSFHAIEGPSTNRLVNVNSFTNGYTATSMVYCTSCHSGSDPGVLGPHGSRYRYLLNAYYTNSPTRRAAVMARTELCFKCHRYDTYANNGATSAIKAYSRFNPPAIAEGHTYHVSSQRYSCYNCHETHGSTNRPTMMVTGRSPGINTYTQTATGGSCSPTCHGSESYTLNYAR